MGSSSEHYRIVRLADGVCSLRSMVHQETFHPGIGPVAEAQALYVEQLKLRERMRRSPAEFVVWDVGLGAAANALTVIRAARDLSAPLRLVSFDQTLGALEFGLEHADQLGYFQGYEERVRALIRDCRVDWKADVSSVQWEFHLGDFPSLVASWCEAGAHAGQFDNARPPAPHLIMFDAYSPAKNPSMWSHSLFAGLFGLLDPDRSCSLATYSRSTLLRTTLLLAGFYVGSGEASGEKEETTIAANTLELIERPLTQEWLRRAFRSTSAEPLWDSVYRQMPLSPDSRQRLERHSQFARTETRAMPIQNREKPAGPVLKHEAAGDETSPPQP